MAFCEECGNRLPEGARKCPACGAVVEGFIEEQHVPQTPPTVQMESRSMTSNGEISLGGLLLAENEQVVRQYQSSNIKEPPCKGYLTVTNKRIIFQGQGLTSRVSKEVVLDSVSGLDCYYGTNVNVRSLVFGGLLALLGLVLIAGDGTTIFGIIALVLGIMLIVKAFRKSFFLAIFSSKASGSPISIGEGARSLLGNGALYSLVSEPTADTDRMLNELGALVQDLQTLGDHAIEKWKEE